jgi:DNA-binding protein HU-beta
LSPFEERKEDNLNRKELIRLVAKDNSLTLGDSEFCINAVCNAISKVVNGGDKLSIYGFGTFQKVRRKPKPYRHPVTGEMCVPEPSDVIKFVPGVAFFPSTEPDYADL